MKAIFLCEMADSIAKVYAPQIIASLKTKLDLCDTVYTKELILSEPEKFSEVDLIFSTWNMPVLSEAEIQRVFPSLKCVFYAAGTVQYFARPFLNCGVRVFSSWVANAVPVAEYTVSQILLANKGYFATSRFMSEGNYVESRKVRECFPGNYDIQVGLIGVGQIAKLVIHLLKQYKLKIKVFSRSLTDEKAAELGVDKCSLEEIFTTCQVVSNHLANNATTQGMLCRKHFESMLPYATFLNTGRGAQVVEDDLAVVLKERPDLSAVLDVTFPEPPLPGHAFYLLPNCILTPHIAGSIGNEVQRMAEYMLEEYCRFNAGEKCRYEVTEEMLKTMA